MTARDVVREAVLDAAELGGLQAWVDDVEAWPSGSHRWGQYAELTTQGPRICRTENVSACHEGVARLVDGQLAQIAADAMGEPVTPFKDKVNYKQPGGAGFSPHQDRRAYPGVDRVTSMLLAIDDCTEDSGCIWLADGVDELLPVDERGVVRADIAGSLAWYPVELRAGDAMCIGGFAPHYSAVNGSSVRRRVLVASYAPASEGYDRAAYYDARAERMRAATARDGRFRISTLADFDGVEVEVAHTADACTHA
jgi:hypothetical protein